MAAAAAAFGGALRGSRGPAVTPTEGQPPAQAKPGYLRSPVVLATIPGILLRQQPLAEADAATAAVSEGGEVTEPADEPAAGEAAIPTATPEPEPAFFTYTIQEGDTVSDIAARFGVDVDYILWNNPELVDDPDLLVPGQDIVIPSVNGLIYHVRLGDTLSDIADFYQIDVQSIVAFVPNRLESPDTLIEGAVLLLPGAVPPPPPIPAAVTVVESTAPPPDDPEPAPEPEPEPEPAASSGFIWPWYGIITSPYGEPRGNGSYHSGIDIDAYGQYGAPVVAAASGQVILAAYLDWGYGYHVIIQHPDGTSTVYAHLSEIYVVQGQYVEQGEAVGAIGCTGYCTGPHLHFEIRVDGVAVDPLSYLP